MNFVTTRAPSSLEAFTLRLQWSQPNVLARAGVTSSARSTPLCAVVQVADVDQEAKRAEEQAQMQHEAALVEKRAKVSAGRACCSGKRKTLWQGLLA